MECDYCGATFTRSKSTSKQLDKSRHNRSHSFCDNACRGKFSKKQADNKYETNPKICKCGAKLTRFQAKAGNDYCSRKCSRKFSNSGRKKDKNRNVYCKHCGALINGKYRNIYCDSKCAGKARKERSKDQNILRLERGEFKDNHRPQLRKILIEEYGMGSKCDICDISDWMNKPLVFILDHIDGNAANNKLENLRFICSNCDSQLDTYKNKNKGRGRKSLGL